MTHKPGEPASQGSRDAMTRFRRIEEARRKREEIEARTGIPMGTGALVSGAEHQDRAKSEKSTGRTGSGRYLSATDRELPAEARRIGAAFLRGATCDE